jgi:CP family cyanate transporter-like MFS transporter
MKQKTGSILAAFAIGLLALNLRTAVSSFSPIVTYIQTEISLPIVTIGLLGIAAPMAFAIATSLSYRPTRRLGVERTLTLTVLMIVSGHLIRALAWDSTSLFFGSLLALLGVGIGNVLLPVMVRKYFAHRVGLVASIYISLTALSATTGSLVAVPVAEAAGWRFSLGQWAILAALTLVPLIGLRKKSTPEKRAAERGAQKAIWRSPTAIAIAATQGMTSVLGYVSFAWLPLLLIEHNQVTVAQGGLLLSLFALMGLPASLLVPILATRYHNSHKYIVWFSGTMGIVGTLGILFSGNESLWLWVMLYGLGPSMFPLALTLFNLRSRERSTVLAVSAFGQGMSYIFATIIVFSVGVLRQVTGGWEITLWLLFAISALSLLAGLQLAKNHFVDDELKH